MSRSVKGFPGLIDYSMPHGLTKCPECKGKHDRPYADRCRKCTAKRISKSIKKSYSKRPLRILAATKVHKAIKDGVLINLSKNIVECVDCGKRATSYDHRDYRKPLQVDPVCQSCNCRRGPGSPYKRISLTRPKIRHEMYKHQNQILNLMKES